MIKTLKEVRSASDQELLDCVNEAAGKTGKEFKDTFGTEYSYSALTTELGKRGFVNGWHKPEKNVPMTTVKEIEVFTGATRTRCNIPVNKTSGETFNNFLNCLEENGALSHGMRYVYYTAALVHFMDDYVNGKITIKTVIPTVQTSMDKLRNIVSSECQDKPKSKSKKSE